MWIHSKWISNSSLVQTVRMQLLHIQIFAHKMADYTHNSIYTMNFSCCCCGCKYESIYQFINEPPKSTLAWPKISLPRFISFHFGFCWPCHLNWHASKWWSTNTHKIHQLEIWCCVLFVLPDLQKCSKGRHTNKHNLDRKKWYLLFFRALLCREWVWRDERWENRNEWSHPEAVSPPYMYNIWTAADQERNEGANDWMEKERMWFRYYFLFWLWWGFMV